jgi:WhiB family redox-sensing transcriptional regulator
VSDWKSYGACRNLDEDLFFPDPKLGQKAAAPAKAICADCFVRGQCLDYALAHHEMGIWGGTTERERRVIQARYVRLKTCLTAN